ncbi:MAG: TIGR01777 family oxidoreductase [Desulfobacterales bacterium]|nr:TIGR01777 family oxidoreductase [Desulfobacterales bacterium]
MNILITGGSGFVGSHMVRFFLERGDRVVAMGRRAHDGRFTHDRYRYVQADTTAPGHWQAEVADADAVVNLAGQTIFNRWSKQYKQQIYDSRILTTRHLAEAVTGDREMVFCSASAVGVYGDRGDDLLTENEPTGTDFLSRVARDWEDAALKAQNRGARVILARFGLVLGADGGALAKMVPAFRALAGGPMGSGGQWVPWIHIGDLVAAVAHMIGRGDLAGPVNVCAPNPVRNRDMARSLGRLLNRPSIMPAPAFALRLAMGELASVLLVSQRAVPERLTTSGFVFRFTGLDAALADLLRPEP